MQSLFCLLPLLIASSFQTVLSTTFTVTNNCGYEVWPGVLSNAGSAALDSTGFALAPGESRALAAPVPWSGRLWARTLCSADSSSGRFICGTGDCGTGAVSCGGAGAAPPATLVEFTLGGAGATDFYDVSLVDGFNLPVLVEPLGGAGAGCAATWCAADVNAVCPPELRVAAARIPAAACKSACMAFGTARYCCSGEFGSPAACGPTPYSELFKSECPRAYSYAYDDASSTFTCPTAAAAAAGGYAVTFCPETTSLVPKGGDQNPEAAGSPSANGTMVFFDSANLAAGDVPYLLHQFWGVFALVIYLFYH